MAVRLEPGAVVRARGGQYCVRRFAAADAVLAEDLGSGELVELAFSEIVESSAKTDSRIDLAELDEATWQRAIERYRAVRQVLDARHPGRAAVEAVANACGVSVPTLYRWVSTFAKSGAVVSLVRKRRNDRGGSRLDPRQEEIVAEVIGTVYLTDQRRRPSNTLRETNRRLRSASLAQISMPTLVSRIERLAPQERAERREQRKLASRLAPIAGSMRQVDTPMAMLQIDHTQVDLHLVDEVHRIPIGRPWVTLAIDVYSRMCAGWYISLDPPGTLSTGICIANAMLPKEPELARLAVSYRWPVQGKPGIVHADNAREFRGAMLRVACQNHQFDLQFRQLKKPQYGAHIERLMGTLGNEIHALPGTTFSNVQDRLDYDSEAKAAMTLPEFERWLANLILGAYHNRVHSEIGCPPIKRYTDGILGDEHRPGVGSFPIVQDPQRLRMDFLPLEQRTIQPTGVSLDNIDYWGEALVRWIGARKPGAKRYGRKFTFRRDPRNISEIYFWDPQLEAYFPLTYRDRTHPAISLWELRAVHRYMREKGIRSTDEAAVFQAFDAMQQIEQDAIAKTARHQRVNKDLREQQRRRHYQQTATANATRSGAAQVSRPEVEPDDDLFDASEVKPYAQIERYSKAK